MQVRTTAILGAGAVLDFNFEGIECGICPLDTFKQFVHIQEGCWLSPNGTLMLFTNGMQHAIMNNQDEILNFLQKRPPLSSHVVSTKKS